MNIDNKRITICACASRTFIDKEKVASLAAQAEKAGWQVEIVPDLCELAEDKDSKMADIATTVVAACHERAVKSLLAFCEQQAPTLINLRTGSIEEAIAKLHESTEATPDDSLKEKYLEMISAMPKKLGEDAWYPCIDKDVCGECGKCLDFCPFGVYEMVNDRIRVVHPHNCKNNCPACARTCPANAIIFPKYERQPINGGIEREENAVQLDTKTLYAKAFKERLEHRRSLTKGGLIYDK